MKNLGQMMKQAQEMQAKMAELQEQLARTEVTGAAGGGMVQVTLNGKGEMRAVRIDPALVDPNEVEVLEHPDLARIGQRRVDGDGAHLALAVERDLDHAAAGRAGDFGPGQLLLQLRHLGLHLLGLLHHLA
jgi:hypothetical protein